MKDFNRHAMLLFGILVGLAFGIVIGVWSPDIGRPFWTDPDCAGPRWYCFAYSWQTLIAGSAALFGAAWTIKKIQKQIEFTHWEHATREIDDLREEVNIVSFLRAIISDDLSEEHVSFERMFETTLFNFEHVIERIPSERFCEKSAEYESQIKLQTGGPEATRRRLDLQKQIDATIKSTKAGMVSFAAEWNAYRLELGEERATPHASVPEDTRQNFIEKTEAVFGKYKALEPFLDEHKDFISARIATLINTYMLMD